ncbi:MAG: hypothetical protein P4L46_22170 [Fimbriimonas sp.]|nr:hypothetical protein [Fimbriimonas sp.]
MLHLISLALAAMASGTPGSPDVARFAASCKVRYSDYPDKRFDPGISAALETVIDDVVSRAKFEPNPSDRQINSWLQPFLHAIHAEDTNGYDSNDFRGLGAEVYRVGTAHIVVARMGAVTRSVAFDAGWAPIRLPKSYFWNSPWKPWFRMLPCGLVFSEEVSIQSTGTRVGIHLEWLRFEGRCAVRISHFNGRTRLDDLPVQVRGNRVSVQTADRVRAFFDYPSIVLFPRASTWVCSKLGAHLVESVPGNLALRAFDRALAQAWSARRPSRLQREIRRVFPRDPDSAFYDLEKWSQINLPHRVSRITVNGEAWIDLRAGRGGYRVIRLGKKSTVN